MTMETLVVPVEWKATDGDENVLEGYASTFGNVDLGMDVVQRGAFKKTVNAIKAKGIPLLADHIASTAHVLGTIFDAKETQKGLWIKARFSSAPSAQDVRIKLLEKHLDKLSIGYDPVEYKFADDDHGHRVRLLQEVKVWETSVVVFPMNPEAAVTRVKSVVDALGDDARKALLRDLMGAETDEAAETKDDASADEVGDQNNPDEHATDEAASKPDEGEQQEPTTGELEDGSSSNDWRWLSAAVHAGRDPEAVADSAERVGLATTLELMEQWAQDNGLPVGPAPDQ